MRRGYTLAEAVTVVGLVGLAASIALPPLARLLDAAAVREATDRYAALHHRTRRLALARGTLARLELDTVARTATLSVRNTPAWDTVVVQAFGDVRLSASQPVVTFSPVGLGFGLSNSRLVFLRGTSADTLTLSRTGRLKR